MDRFATFVIRRRKAIITVFAVLTLICALLFPTISVNYDMSDYLPRDAQSTKAIDIMSREFESAVPNADVIVYDVSLMEALALKYEIGELPHVTDILWLDDITDILRPLEMSDPDLIESYYKNGNARFPVVINKGDEQQALAEIYGLIGDKGTVIGDAADVDIIQNATNSEVLSAVYILVPIIILILILSTTSWIEPLLFLSAIGVSVAINMGTNAFVSDISFLTNSVTPILQLAVSLDYAIFLLHSFGAHRKTGLNVETAMHDAIKESFSTVSASAATTLFGFMALLFMDFRIGSDLGLSLAKGIVFSFISVMVFLPALTICVYKAIDKTKHRDFMPKTDNIYGFLRRLSIPIAIIVTIIIVPCFLGQSETNFLYGYQLEKEDEIWDDPTVIVMLTPKGDVVKEEMLTRDISAIPYVISITSYVTTIGPYIPPDFLDPAVSGQFYSENYARIIITVDTPAEGEAAFETVELIAAVGEKYYPRETYLVGRSANLYDIKTIVRNDNRVTDLIATISIFLVILIVFRSAALPFILLLTIKTAIWINLSIPYFTDTSINYIGYLVLNTVQLGATIDYAVLLTMTYMRRRRESTKKEAIHSAMGSSFNSILVSAATLSSAGFILALTSSNPIVADIGMLLGRGTLLSLTMVVVFLPVMLTAFDKVIERTTYGSNFFKAPL